jgi:transposase-like protein
MVRKKTEPNRIDDRLDDLLGDCQGPEDILGESGLLKQLSTRLVEGALAGELGHHLAQAAANREADSGRRNSRNGYSNLIRNCLRYVPWKDSKAVVADLKPIYQAATLAEAETALEAFAAKWDEHYPAISQIWLRHWENIIPIFDYPMDIRKAIYTTNAIESS